MPSPGARRCAIVRREKALAYALASPGDFVVEATDESIDPARLLSCSQLSLYCLDPSARAALFVETPADTDLYSAPFLYQTQYERALQVYSLPWEILLRMAEQSGAAGPESVYLYSTGRCGSTLLGAALSLARGTVLVSEPDVFTQLVALRSSRALADDREVSALLRACTAVTCAAAARAKGASTVLLKFRSYVIQIGELLHAISPAARLLFLYRHPEPTARSFARLLGLYDPQGLPLDRHVRRLRPLVPTLDEHLARGPIDSPAQLLAHLWLSTIEKFLALRAEGAPILALRYEDILADPGRVLGDAWTHCGLDVDATESWSRVLMADAQEGTPLSRERLQQVPAGLHGEELAVFRQMLAEHGIDPDLLPGAPAPER